MTTDGVSCLLCNSLASQFTIASSGRYFACPRCQLVFRHPEQFPTATAEREFYDTHENDVHDAGYRRFLSRLSDELFPRLAPGARGLDFGCGPGPALVAMGREAGFEMHGFDPWFADDRRLLDAQYDFITCTETVEHFHQPRAGFDQLDKLLAPGGWLGVMTGTPPVEPDAFAAWHYHRDPTHVCFFGRGCMRWLAGHLGWQVEFPAANVSLFRRPAG